MKMKMILAAGALLAGAQAHGLLIGAFDFAETTSWYNTVIDASQTDLSNNTSVITADNNDINAGNFVTMETSGFTNSYNIADGGLTTSINGTISSRGDTDQYLNTTDTFSLQTFYAAGQYFDIVIDLGEGRSVYDLVLTYAYKSADGSDSGITWTILGSDYSWSASTTSEDWTLATADTMLTTETDALTTLTIRATLTGTGNIDLDNIQLNGTVLAVPEPSTYAAIAGGLVLAVVALRRRRK